MHGSLIQGQLDAVIARNPERWRALDGASFFVTGGTGFLGRWFLEALLHARSRLNLALEILVLSRDINGFLGKAPYLADLPGLKFLRGDVQSFTFPSRRFDYIFHGAATSALATFRGEEPLAKFDMALNGTRRVLDFARENPPKRILLMSSGNVYAGVSSENGLIREDYKGAPLTDDFEAGLGHGKRAAEFMAACYAKDYGLQVTIARCFSFVGAFLPFNIHYALGNFIRDALYEPAVVVKGDGSPIRSYLFAGDLTNWLASLLAMPGPRMIYNVGSDQTITLRDLADLVRDQIAPEKPVRVLGRDQGGPRSFYAPDITRVREDFDLQPWTPLDQAIRLTAELARRERWGDS